MLSITQDVCIVDIMERHAKSWGIDMGFKQLSILSNTICNGYERYDDRLHYKNFDWLYKNTIHP